MSVVSLAGQSANVPVDLPGLLAVVGERIEAYYQRAQSIVCTETVHLLSMDLGFTPDPHTRRLVYELRVSWEKAGDSDATPEANVLRQLKLIDGRPPKPGEEPGCLDPKPVFEAYVGRLDQRPAAKRVTEQAEQFIAQMKASA